LKIAGISWGRQGTGPSVEEPGVFTHHVRLLTGKEPLDAERLEPLWASLRGILRSELKRRGLWESPPAYLGIYGWESWDTPGGRKGGALEELLAECYTFIFVLRLRSLQAQLQVKPNVDGLVFLNIRHFLHERQKEHDPVGSQVFEVLRSAVRTALAAGELHLLAGNEQIRNDTVLSFSASTGTPAPAKEGIAALVARWNDELLPDLVTLRGQQQEGVVRRLRERLPDLRREGFEGFRFKDLVDPLKADVRTRWAAILDQSQGEAAPQIGEAERRERVRLALPDLRIEERQLFRRLIDCVLASTRHLETSEKTRGYLTTLWQFARVQAAEEETPAAPASRLDRLIQEAAEEESPSLRRLAEQLHIPRERLPGLYKILGDLLQRCRAANSGRAAVALLKGHSGVQDGRTGSDVH
jgi:hypothetical protein